MRRLSTASAALLVITAVACGGSTKTSSSTTTKPTTTTTTTTPTKDVSPSTTTRAPVPCVAGSTTEQKSPVSAGVVQLVAVNVGSAAPCGDIVTFVFPSGGASQVPGYDIQYKHAPFYDAGSGKLHQVAGNAFLVVRMEQAAIVDLSSPGGGQLTYKGPLSIHPAGLAHVKNLEVIDAFEGVLTWVIGLDSQRSFHVATGHSIPSIVVTIG